MHAHSQTPQAPRTPSYAPVKSAAAQQGSGVAVSKTKQQIQEFKEYLAKPTIIQSIRAVLPKQKKKDLERILRIALMEYKGTPALHKCSTDSVMYALMSACRLGLEVGSLTGHAYLIPYGDRCTLQVGYKGLVELAYRMGTVRSIRAKTVYANDEFEIRGGTEDSIYHKICLGDKGEIIGYYVVVDIQDARPVFHYMSCEEIAAHKTKYAKGGGKFWEDFPEQMAYKTIFIKLFKWLPHNPFLKDVSEIESVEYGYNTDPTPLPAQTRASEVAEAIGEEPYYEDYNEIYQSQHDGQGECLR